MNFGGFGFEDFAGGGGGFGGGGRRKKGEPDTKYYDLLGVDKDATKEQITKAYRNLARKLHPDRNPDPEAKEKFQDLTQAYETLTDPKKKEIYDQYGEEGLKEGDGFGGDPHDFMSHFFGGGHGRSSRHNHGPQRSEEIGFKFGVTLQELYVGKTSKLKITRRVLCKTCTGRGSKSDAASQKCTHCNGRGIRVVIQRIGPMITQSQVICDVCRGQKVVIAEKDRCGDCKGKKVEKEEKTLEVPIMPGSQYGEVQTFYGEGEHLPETEPGDVKVQFVEKEEEDSHFAKFKRQGDDLVVEWKVTLLEALVGFTFHLKHFDGRILVVKSEPGDVVKPGDVKKIEGEGMPKKGNAFTKGNLYIKFDVAFPKPGTVSEKMKNTLLSVLEVPAELPKLEGEGDEEVHFEEVVAKSIDMEAFNTEDDDDEYEDEEGGGGRRMECINNIM
eukprot:TRINITY_DN267_c0_g1_i1.p1 TRINITY_DN267_c0_g1~~TRINITY_DN267_c0_g1_i1.p1  ORF type:complete len:465 (-),score=164.06 TRINITY_DN267_c0_g1_i1:105-1430(-)